MGSIRNFQTVSEVEFSEVHMAEQSDREEQEPRGARYRSLLASSDSGTVSACRWATFQSPSSRRYTCVTRRT